MGIITLGLLACSESGLGTWSAAQPGADVPAISVTPERVDFGVLAGGLSEVATLTVTNTGGDDSVLEVERVELLDDAGNFVFLEFPDSFRLPFGQSREVDVVFSPTNPDAHVGAVTFYSDDPDRAAVDVDLLGNGARPELQISPDPLDLGAVPVGCTVDGEVTLTNVGSFELTVDAAALAGEGYALATPLSGPILLPPGSAQALTVAFSPVAQGHAEAELAVTSDEPAGRRTSRVAGEGIVPVERIDRFTLEPDPRADLLFFVDQSWSMRDDSAALAANFDAFIAQIDIATTKWRIVVVNDDNGCERSGVLERTVPDYAGAFRGAVRSGGGSLTESGLSVVARALELMGPGECNEGMLREDTPLHVIFVTDEPEESPGPWEDYLARMQTALGAAWRLRVSTVGGPVPDGCTTTTNSATPALRFVDVVAATGGAFLSICSPWSDSVGTLAEVSTRRDTFGLSGVPDARTVRVEVDGVAASGWVYDAALNAVVFDRGREPREGQTVEAFWTEALACPARR